MHNFTTENSQLKWNCFILFSCIQQVHSQYQFNPGHGSSSGNLSLPSRNSKCSSKGTHPFPINILMLLNSGESQCSNCLSVQGEVW